MKERFVHLHNHTEYSFGRGILRIGDWSREPSEFLKAAVSEGMPAVAITDRGNLYGAIEFYLACRRAGINPIIGCEMSVAQDNRYLTVLSRDFEGYQNLMALSSEASLEGCGTPCINKELLAEHAKGLIVLSGCLEGVLCPTLPSGDMDGACRLAMEYRDILEEGCFFIELMDHGMEQERQVLKGLLEVHKRTGIPLVATNDNHYLHKADAAAQDALLCISAGKLISDDDRPRMGSSEFYFKTPQEMAKLFGYSPEALANTVSIAEMCHLEIPFSQLHLPDFLVPEWQTQDTYLETICREELALLGLTGNEDYEKRLAFELGVIRRMGYSGYFLIVWDFISYAKRNGIPVGPGRGASAGSLVAFTLGITAIDPIRYKLLYERFMNPDRKSMPDIDIDFSPAGREKVVEYIRGKYGSDRVAAIITFGARKARLAIREVGRAMGIKATEIDKLSGLIPYGPGNTLAKAMREIPQFAEATRSGQAKELYDLASRLEGLKSCAGVHAAGIAITKEAVWKHSPLVKSASGVVTTQYDGECLPMLGMLKMDLLSLRSLDIIVEATRLVRERCDKGFELAKVPMDDAMTYELLASGQTPGVFQLDSEGMQALLRRIKPSCFEDISAAIALYRPGPMEAGILDLFIGRKHGKHVDYGHLKLESILKDTYGIIIYQEQVMEIAKSLADFTPGEADMLRKAMGKKISEDMEKFRGHFIDGAKKNGVGSEVAVRIFNQIEKYGGYSFNKSHTVAYGMIGYQMAYLKANYPAEFAAALPCLRKPLH